MNDVDKYRMMLFFLNIFKKKMIYIWIKLKVFNNKEDRSLLSL